MKTRKEQIEEAAQEMFSDFGDEEKYGFIRGAQWVDEHPDWDRLHRKFITMEKQLSIAVEALNYVGSDFCKDNQDFFETAKEALTEIDKLK
jgi:hypothetical protein